MIVATGKIKTCIDEALQWRKGYGAKDREANNCKVTELIKKVDNSL